jgi:oligoendopeptidase F
MGDKPAEDVLWRLDDLYQGGSDPQIEADKRWCREQAESFAATYKGRIAHLSAPELHAAIRHYESLSETAQRLLAFAYLNFATQTQNAQASALWQSLQELGSLLQRDILFFELEWNGVPEEDARRTVSQPEMASYKHFLEAMRRYEPHQLSEKEERLLAEKEPAGAPAWCTLFDKVLSGLRFGESKRTESEVLSDLHRPDRETRSKTAAELTEGLDSVLHILTHIFNTILLDKSIMDRVRSHPHWLHSRNLDNEADDAMVASLVEAVSSRYDLVQRYYLMKRQVLRLEELYDYDRYAPNPWMPEKAFGWEEAKQIVLSAYQDFSPTMAEIAGKFFDEHWIHAPVLGGKRAGAFAHPVVPSAHPYVFLNFTGTHRDVMTLAHELGHGIHQYLARKQGLLNSHTPLTTAESASVFGEMLVFRHLLQHTQNPRDRFALLGSKLEDIFATVFRQVSMNRFEDAVHNARRQTGELDTERISELWMSTQTAMFGSSVTLLDHYRTWWSYIPHFVHSPGYVYAYAYGELLVLALYRKYLEDGPPFTALYLEYLEGGGSARPDELLRPFGVDLKDPRFWLQGLTVLEVLLQEAERELQACEI